MFYEYTANTASSDILVTCRRIVSRFMTRAEGDAFAGNRAHFLMRLDCLRAAYANLQAVDDTYGFTNVFQRFLEVCVREFIDHSKYGRLWRSLRNHPVIDAFENDGFDGTAAGHLPFYIAGMWPDLSADERMQCVADAISSVECALIEDGLQPDNQPPRP